jgi:enamine deaminase RidA (YjgF/YER057c/UK114 family)
MKYSRNMGLRINFSGGTILFAILITLLVHVLSLNGIVYAEEGAFDPEQRLKQMGIKLRRPPTPVANYVQAVRAGNLVFLAGHGPRKPDGGLVVGRVGSDLTPEQGKEAARLTAIDMLTSLKAEIGDLRRVKRIVKVVGMVNTTASFTEHPKVVNGCSDLLVAVFGDRGRHARCAVGMGSLPFNIPIEIDMIVEVE